MIFVPSHPLLSFSLPCSGASRHLRKSAKSADENEFSPLAPASQELGAPEEGEKGPGGGRSIPIPTPRAGRVGAHPEPRAPASGSVLRGSDARLHAGPCPVNPVIRPAVSGVRLTLSSAHGHRVGAKSSNLCQKRALTPSARKDHAGGARPSADRPPAGGAYAEGAEPLWTAVAKRSVDTALVQAPQPGMTTAVDEGDPLPGSGFLHASRLRSKAAWRSRFPPHSRSARSPGSSPPPRPAPGILSVSSWLRARPLRKPPATVPAWTLGPDAPSSVNRRVTPSTCLSWSTGWHPSFSARGMCGRDATDRLPCGHSWNRRSTSRRSLGERSGGGVLPAPFPPRARQAPTMSGLGSGHCRRRSFRGGSTGLPVTRRPMHG